MRKHIHSSYSPSTNSQSCTASPYKECIYNPTNKVPSSLSSSYSFISCSFTSLTSPVSGGAVAFTCGSTNSLTDCTFNLCSTSVSADTYTGGGAVFSSSGTLSAISCTFLSCSSSCFGGGLFGTKDGISTSAFECVFVECTAEYSGGGICTHYGSSSDVFSSRFLSCECMHCGGGVYHNNEAGYPIKISGSLFRKNVAKWSAGSRGGGAFEDCKTGTYQTHLLFSFFTLNTAPNGVGNDMSVINKLFDTNNILDCFTTTTFHSFWNHDNYIDNWLLLHLLIINKLSTNM